MKKFDRLIDIADNSEWTFDARTRAPDRPSVGSAKATITWTIVLSNQKGERRFVPEERISDLYKLREG